MKYIKMIYKHINNNKFILYMFILTSIVNSIVTVTIPYLSGKYIDLLNTKLTLNNIYNFCSIFILLVIISITLQFISNLLLVKIKTNTVFLLNLEVLEHIKRLPLSFFDKIDIVYLNQRINNDVITLVNFIFDNLFKVFITTISLIVYIILITNISYISSIIILALLVSSLILYKIFHKKIYNTTFKYKEEQNQYFSAMNLQIENIKYIKTNSMYEYLTNKLKYKFNKLYFHTKKYAFISYMYVSIDSLIFYGGNVLIYLVGGILFLHGNLTIGSIIIILSYFY